MDVWSCRRWLELRWDMKTGTHLEMMGFARRSICTRLRHTNCSDLSVCTFLYAPLCSKPNRQGLKPVDQIAKWYIPVDGSSVPGSRVEVVNTRSDGWGTGAQAISKWRRRRVNGWAQCVGGECSQLRIGGLRGGDWRFAIERLRVQESDDGRGDGVRGVL